METTKPGKNKPSRLYRAALAYDTGIISAERHARDCGRGKKHTERENRARSESLFRKLLYSGYAVAKPDIPWTGTVFFVIDIHDSGRLEKDLTNLGAEFEQDAVIFGKAGGREHTAIRTNDCPNGWPGKRIGDRQPLGCILNPGNGLVTNLAQAPFRTAATFSGNEPVNRFEDMNLTTMYWTAKIARISWEEYMERAGYLGGF